ncbi:hypothetical protein [Pseudomonas viridiflava]|uniref:hypothetical protein n=1 Tax=Pseudomonas viridiflava TaxID=33069 RepID=UPI000F05846C|nr:hypothetical protein [Pseudomonas viridiflava]
MSDKEHYEIEYTLAGEHHVDVIEDLDVPIIEVVHELAQKHHVALDDVHHSTAVDLTTPHASGITDVSIHSVEEEDLQVHIDVDTRITG